MTNILKNKVDLIKTLIDSTPIAYVILDKEYRIHYINESFSKLRKLDMNTTIGNFCYNLSNNGVKCKNCAVAKTLATGEKAFVTRKDVLQTGAIRFIDDYAMPLQYSEDGKVEFVLEMMIDRTKEMLSIEQRNKDFDEILSLLASLLESKDAYTATHSDNVRKISFNIAQAMGLSQNDVFEISVAASLHDIGKVTIPDSIINKNGKLTDDEYMQIKNHPVASHEMLEGLKSFSTIRDIALHHHERVDGFGYPDGFSGDEISLGSKIVAVADTYDAITTTRSYRKELSHDYAIQEIKRVAGKQLDKEVVNTVLTMDFNNLSDGVYDPTNNGSKMDIERVIVHSAPETHVILPDMKNLSKIDLDNLLAEIFKSTPCGYCMMDVDTNVLYASDYFIDFFELTQEYIQGKTWKDLITNTLPTVEKSAIESCIASGSPELVRQETLQGSKHKIFDVYGVPLKAQDGSTEYIIGITIDRTKEILLKREREHDFKHIITMLEKILHAKKEKIDEQNLSQNIIDMQNRLNELLEQK